MIGWQVLSTLAVTTAIFAACLLYMAAKFFGSPQLEAVSKSELVQAIASSILILFIIIAVPYFARAECGVLADLYKNAFSGVGYLWLSAPQHTHQILTPEFIEKLDSPPLVAVYFFDALINQYYVWADRVYQWDMFFQTMTGQISSVDVFMNTPKGVGFMATFTSITTSLLNHFYFYILWFKFIIYVLLFFHAFALPVLFPVGAALRAFPLTRGVGAYILAFTIGIYFVLPFALLVLCFVVSNPATWHFIIKPASASTASGTQLNTFSQVKTALLLSNSEMGDAIKQVLLANSTAWQRVKTLLNIFENVIQVLLSQVCLFPFAAIAFTMATIHGLNQLFGARIPEIGRGIIKFI